MADEPIKKNRVSAKPVPVTIADTPVKVVVEEGEKEKRLVESSAGKTVLAPNTTEQEDMTTAGQRRVNLIWEFTQAIIAVSITWAIIYMGIKGLKNQELFYAFFLIVSMYFVRTNHSIVGGVGKKVLGQHR